MSDEYGFGLIEFLVWVSFGAWTWTSNPIEWLRKQILNLVLTGKLLEQNLTRKMVVFHNIWGSYMQCEDNDSRCAATVENFGHYEGDYATCDLNGCRYYDPINCHNLVSHCRPSCDLCPAGIFLWEVKM